MKRKNLTPEEFAKRIANIEEVEPDSIDKAMLQEADEVNDGTTVDYDDFIAGIEAYSGKFLVRMPRSLHKELSENAKLEGVSLNQYAIYKLSRP
ncbi:MAG: toxin-antitoxin system HicB family antitoxin [Clostridiales bacterium]|jgi:hypothetical protein|nr:toxin-antitoxin system HicB family antitoxin [Clostridiales bacterium]